MNEFYGDLLIGGARLQHVHGELEHEQPSAASTDWELAGSLHLRSEECEQLQAERSYRLQLDDGRAGQVVVLRIAPKSDDARLVDFRPAPRHANLAVPAFERD